MSLTGVGVQVEQLHPPSLVAEVPHPGGTTQRLTAVDDDAQVAAEHAKRLETVRPDHGLKKNNFKCEIENLSQVERNILYKYQ